jgi:competence protein ComEC
MKLPSLFPVGLFASGILLAIAFPSFAWPRPRIWVLAILMLLLSGIFTLRSNWVITSLLLAAGAWFTLGITASLLEHAAVSTNPASALIESGQLDSTTALRWRGQLRGDPLRVPWGWRYEIGIEQVESSSGFTPVSGGLRITYYGAEAAGDSPAAIRSGDRVEAFVRARPVYNFGDPGSFDFRGYLARQDIQLQGALRDARLLTVVDHPPLSISDRLARVRGRLLDSLNELFADHPEEGALARAMLLGDHSFVDRDRAVDFQKTGVYHVLVVAGLHVGALAAFLLWAGRRLRLALFPRIFLTLAALAAYACIVEDRPPVLRAVLMAGIFLSAVLLYRRMDLINVAAIAALVMLAGRPSEITDASFLLSFSAIAAIGAIAVPAIEQSSQPYRRALEHLSDVTRDASHPPRAIQFRLDMRAAASWISARLPQAAPRFGAELLVHPLRAAFYVCEIVFVSAILQLGMMPPLAYYFHRVALAGPLANVPALLLVGLAVPLGFLTLVAGFVSHGLAIWMAKLLDMILALLESTVRWFASWHGASYRIPGPSVEVMVLFVALAIVLSAAIRLHRGRGLIFSACAALLATAAVIAIHPFSPQFAAHRLEVTVLDIGQGDSIFVSFPQGRTMLVDAGGEIGAFHSGGMRSGIDVGEDVVSPYLWSRGLKKIDVVALTHAHEDHLGGLSAVFENFKVGELWVGRDIESEAYRQVLESAASQGTVIRHLKQGDTFSDDGVAGAVLWPDDDSERRSAKNDDSLVLRLTDGEESFLLAGDIETPSERAILAEEQAVGVNFLKVAHHGSKTSTTDAFLNAAHPDFAAISDGRDNRFGHPSPEVTARLAAAGVEVYRTDIDGAITASTDGTEMRMSTYESSK